MRMRYPADPGKSLPVWKVDRLPRFHFRLPTRPQPAARLRNIVPVRQIRYDPIPPTVRLHLVIFYSRNRGIPGQGQFGTIDNEPDSLPIWHIDHNSIVRHFLTHDLAELTGEIKGFEIAAFIVKRGVAKYDHRNSLTWQ